MTLAMALLCAGLTLYILALFLLFAIVHGGARKPTPRWQDDANAVQLPLDAVYYATRDGIYRYDGESVRRLALEFDLMERERKWRV